MFELLGLFMVCWKWFVNDFTCLRFLLIGVGEKSDPSRFSLQLRISESILSLVFNQMCDDTEFALETPVCRLLPFSLTHKHTTRTFRKIIFHKFQKGWSELQGHSRDSFHKMRCERHFVWCYTWRVRSHPSYFPYKCSTKLSFMWFGIQWI